VTKEKPVGYSQSPQWRDGRFGNPPEWPLKPRFVRLAYWWFSDRPRGDPGRTPPIFDNDGRRLRDDRRTPSVTWIGHSTLLVQAGGASVITDPVFTSRIGPFRRLTPAGLTPERLPPIDVCIVSHNHRDHLDVPSVLALEPEVSFVVPLGLAGFFRRLGLDRVVELDWWQSVTVRGRAGAHVEVTLVPAQHYSQRGLFDENKSLWGGFHLVVGGLSVYFAGDTGYPAAFAEIGRRFPGIEYALLPIGAYEPRRLMGSQHIGPDEAALAFGELRARSLVPIHWGTFRFTAERLHEPIERLRAVLRSDRDRLVELPIGGTRWEAPSAAVSQGASQRTGSN
jgi:L-ascorbate metabolism protein UlaG (beta-lactamase superfamily)